MRSLKVKLKLISVVLLVIIGTSPSSLRGGTIIKTTGGSSTTLDVRYDGSKFETNGVVGASIEFTGFLKNVLTGLNFQQGSITILGVNAVGAAINPVPNVDLFVQNTFGGSFSLRDEANNRLLLAGNFAEGKILISRSQPTSPGSFRSTKPITYTGGVLLPLVQPLGSFSLSLTQVLFEDSFLSRNLQSGSNQPTPNGLNRFSANLTAQIAAEQQLSAVPEPTSWLVFLSVLLSGCSVFHRRR